LSTPPESTRSFSATSSGSTTFATRFSVSHRKPLLQFRQDQHH
jgi:hypothetical protein